MPKRRSPGIALSDLNEALRNLPVSKAVGKADARSLARSRRLIAELEQKQPAHETAALLGISTQKYAAMKRAVRQGKASSGTLNDLLEETSAAASKLSYGEKTGTYIVDEGHHPREETSYINVPKSFIEKRLPWAHVTRPGGFASLSDTLNWYGNVGGANEYFWIVTKRSKKTGRLRYYIYDIRTPKELAKKGKLTGALKAQKTLERYDKELQTEYEAPKGKRGHKARSR